jgi:hypothetical protein
MMYRGGSRWDQLSMPYFISGIDICSLGNQKLSYSRHIPFTCCQQRCLTALHQEGMIIVEEADGINHPCHTSSVALTSAPLAIKSSATAGISHLHAASRGVRPFYIKKHEFKQI